MNNNYIPMNMIPFIANMKNVSNGGKPTPKPEPFNPTNFVHKIVPFDLGTLVYNEWIDGYFVEDVPVEAVDSIIMNTWENKYKTSFRFTCDGKEYVIIDYHIVNDEFQGIDNLKDIYVDDFTATEHNTFNRMVIITDSDVPTVILYRN